MNGVSSQQRDRLGMACEALGLSLTTEQQDKLLAYLQLLARWNRAYNLTSIPSSAWLEELLLDALVALPYVQRGPVLDVGSGAGLPGIPLAIALPGLDFTLLDSNGKKTRFINQVKIDLQIQNVVVVQSRVEAFKGDRDYALIVSRAYAELDRFIQSTAHLLADDGEWLAWKGENAGAEWQRLSQPVTLLEQIELDLPGVAGRRYLLRLCKKDIRKG